MEKGASAPVLAQQPPGGAPGEVILPHVKPIGFDRQGHIQAIVHDERYTVLPRQAAHLTAQRSQERKALESFYYSSCYFISIYRIIKIYPSFYNVLISIMFIPISILEAFSAQWTKSEVETCFKRSCRQLTPPDTMPCRTSSPRLEWQHRPYKPHVDAW